MIFRKLRVLCLLFSLVFSASGLSIQSAIAKTETKAPTLESAQKALQSQPKFFTENKGQWDPAILFVGSTSFGKVAFAKDAIYYQMIESDSTTSQSQTIKLSFVKPNTPTIKGSDVLPHYNNYFLGNNPKKWASYCRNYANVTYQDVWSGIDLTYFFTPEGMKYEYYVSPEADMKNLQISVEGADLINQGNTLQLTGKLGSIQDANLTVFDQKTGSKMNTTFLVQNNTISFHGIPEKRQNTIVIDPLVYSTYLGGANDDYGKGIAVDAEGNAYITGYTKNNDYPTTPDSYDTTYQGGDDCFVTKLNPSGSSLVYSTFIGGTNSDQGFGIFVDAVGNAYIAGSTESTDYPTTPGAYDTTYHGVADCFVTKLNPSGSSLVYSTYLGGSGNESGNGIAVDAGGTAYIAGYTYSTDYPTTPGAYDTTYHGVADCFVTKLNPSGSSLVYSTYLGGSGNESGNGIAVDAGGTAYIAGYTYSTDYPTTPGAYDTTFNGNTDCFVTKLNPSGSSLVYSTYLGGSGHESGNGIFVDAGGTAYIAGSTRSLDYPTTIGAYDTTYHGLADCFVTKLNPSGSSLVYSTYIGGNGDDQGFGIFVDAVGNTYITGFTFSNDYPTTPGAYDTTYQGGDDCFVTKLNPSGSSLVYSTYLGGSGNESGNGIFVDAVGNAYITGNTGDDYPTTPGAYDTTYQGNWDCFVTKLIPHIVEATLAGNLSYNVVNLSWTILNPDQVTIQGYQVYRADERDNIFQLLGSVNGANNRSYVDTTGIIGRTYSYYVLVLDKNNLQLAKSNTISLGPIRAIPLPVLELSIWTNKTEFCTGEDVLYKVTVFNQSAGAATDTYLSVTFPREIQFMSADKYRGAVQPSGLVVFYLGTIPGNASVTFQINAGVATSVPFEKSTATFFDIQCKEKSTDQSTINLSLKRCGGGPSVLYILVYYKNVSYDVETGEIFLPLSEVLNMDVEFSGFLTPLSYEINWGDGTIEKRDKQSETKYLMKHQFTSKGKMMIKISGTDASGRSKAVTLTLTVK